jgi:uncharacterized membrane protein
MRKIFPYLTAVCLVICLPIACPAQQPCQPGSLANVLDTSCTVGPITLNFGTSFLSGVAPSAIGFVPVVSGNQAGFTLVMNFVENNNGQVVQFEYTPQAAPNSEIRAETVTMDAGAQGAPQGIALVEILDFQSYPNVGFMDPPQTIIDIEQGNVINFILSSQVILPVPGFVSTGSTPFTTELSCIAGEGSSASLASATFLYSFGPIVPAPPAAAYSFSNIDLPDAANTTVSNLNNAGSIVGTFQDAAGNFHGYVTGKDGTTTVVDFPDSTGTFAEGLNDRGDVTGFYNDAAGVSHGFILEDGNFVTLDLPGALLTQPIGINNRRQVVGSYQSADQGFHGFLFDDGQFATIDQGPETGLAASTSPFSISNRGEIAGTFFDPDTLRGFVGRNPVFEDFDVPGQGFTIPSGINDPGTIVGSYNDTNLVEHGFVLTRGSFSTVDFPGAPASFALGINASGLIVGLYADSAGIFHSYLAVPGAGGSSDAVPIPAITQLPASSPVCGSEEWKARVKRRDPRCHVSH